MDKLIDLKMGKYASVEGISELAPLKIKRRLLELGFTKGQKVRLLRKSLLGKTMLVEIRGYILSMRKSLVELVEVKE